MASVAKDFLGRLKGYAETFVEDEKRSLLYWSAVLYGAGIAIYFSLSFEPPIWPALLAIVVLFAGQAFLAGRPYATLVLRGAMILIAGFASATIRTSMVAHETLIRETGPVTIEARIDLVENRIEDGLRLTLRDVAYENGANLPEKIRITVRTKAPDLRPGMSITTRAILLPLPEPVIPGGYDFARGLWFQGFGAVGFAVADVSVLERPPLGLRDRIEGLRQALAARISEAAPGPSGGVAAALITGVRDGIPEEVSENMRIAGLAHLLAISGLHMALVTGVLYLALRWVFALIPRLALKYPVRKFAAFAALVGAFGYLILSGAGLSTQRAFIMVGIVLLAIITDRRAISMRLVALAAIVILTLNPEALLHPSFQMSFAAVTGLVAGYGWLQPRFRILQTRNQGVLGRLRLYVLGVLVSTLIAEITIGPIALYHFGRFSTYGLLANLAAVPVMGLIVMPAGLLGLALIPFGLDSYMWQLMALGIDFITGVAATIATLPNADLHLPEMPMASLAFLVVGGLLLALWQGAKTRRLAFVPLMLGLMFYAGHRLPDVVVDRDGKLIAVVKPDTGTYYFSNLRTASFTRENWLRAFGQSEAYAFEDFLPNKAARLRCDELGCLYRNRVAFTKEPEGFAEDCKRADVIITQHYAPFPCKDAKIVIDRKAISDFGAHAIWLGTTVEVVSVGETRGSRPWTAADQ